MELTDAAVSGRIADLRSLAAELRVARIARAGSGTALSRATSPAGPASRIGALLIGIGTALGGRPAQASR